MIKDAKMNVTSTQKAEPSKSTSSYLQRYHQEIVANPLCFRLVKG